VNDNKKALYLLCLSVLPLMICSGMVYSVLSLYIADDLGASKTSLGLIYMTGAACGAILALSLGKLSDRWGRRVVLVLPMFGFVIAFIMYALSPNYTYVFPIQALEGMTWVALGTGSSAFIVDLMPSEQRGWGRGVYQRTWSVGWILGPLIGGVLADSIGFKSTLLISTGMAALGIPLVLFYLKEPRQAPE
jgi:MFS family permease